MSFRHKDDFLDFLKFSENDFVLFYKTRLQVGEDLHHELSVVLVWPVEEIIGWCGDLHGITDWYSSYAIIGDPEHFLESGGEAQEEEMWEQLILDVIGELVHNCFLFDAWSTLIFVVLPSIGEILLYFSFELDLNFNITIKVPQHPEETCQQVTLVKVCIDSSIFVDDLNEHTHKERKDGNTKKQQECPDKPFNFAIWIQVAESHSRERGKSKIDHLDTLVGSA